MPPPHQLSHTLPVSRPPPPPAPAHTPAIIPSRPYPASPNTPPTPFRHTTARLLLRLQQLMGNEDLRTTRGYVALEQADTEKAYQHASPPMGGY